MRAIFEKDQHLRLSRDGLTAWIRSIGIAAAVGGTYFLAAQLSNSFLIMPETVILWPAAGISSGLLIALWSIARWPVLVGVMVATAAANLLRHFGVAATAAWVLGNTAEPLIVALRGIAQGREYHSNNKTLAYLPNGSRTLLYRQASPVIAP
jgi:hypothetical protein